MSIKEPSIEERLTQIVTVAVLYPQTKRNNSIRAKIDAEIVPRIVGVLVWFVRSERRKAAIEILLRIRDKADFMRGAGMELNIESTIWNELEVLDPSLNDKRIAELESNTEKERS